MQTLQNLPGSLPGLFEKSFSVKIIEVAKKYDAPDVGLHRSSQDLLSILMYLQGQAIERIPEYTVPGGPNQYHCSKSA